MNANPARRGAPARILAMMALAALATGAANAQEAVFKCRAAGGGVAYQDGPCAAGTELEAPVILPPPAYVPPPPVETPAPVLEPEPVAEIDIAEPVELPPLPVMFHCYRYDGEESYYSDNPEPKRYLVPTWAVLPNRAIGGAGSRLNEAPRGATGYTWVEDQCAQMTREDLCGYWRRERNRVHAERRIAFQAEHETLTRQRDELDALRLAHCR